MEISLQLAQTLVDKAIAKAAADFKRPICVAVCDKYGFLLAFGRMDGAPVRSIALSQGKAYSAARMGVDTDAFLERLNRENIPASYFCDDKLTGLPGGVVLKDGKDELIGGAGISGLKPEEDLAIATMMVAEVKQLLK
ncbi:MAG TPA: heme-binding protein [Sporomusaceae bacterium]|uniref:GlcG/HbpS family heme-binding protein n=1 Tax=Anaerospora sp. TaxID=1960278 RepID=UPI000EC634C9|nr:heme-binding protein [Anaerospora sp.]HAK73229.1 heme-binding protein [Sporomusaceae bacterium]